MCGTIARGNTEIYFHNTVATRKKYAHNNDLDILNTNIVGNGFS